MSRFAGWWPAHRGQIEKAVTRLLGLMVLAGLGYLVYRDPETVLEYVQVLAWPALGLAALLIFRQPIIRLLRGVYLKELHVRGARLSFGQEQEQGLLAFVPDEHDPGVLDAEAQVQQAQEMLGVAGALLQSFQIQLDFLEALGRAPEGLTRAAAEEWFEDAIEDRYGDEEMWDIPALVTWLEHTGLVQLSPQGRLVRSEQGDRLVHLAGAFWYAPKLA